MFSGVVRFSQTLNPEVVLVGRDGRETILQTAGTI